MAVRSVQWSSFTKLPCAGCAPSDVILCTTFNLTIAARLTNTTTFKNGTGQLVYRYTFLYDVDDDKFPGFTCSNITGVFCQGCMTQWISEQLQGIINIIPAAPSILNQTAYQASQDLLVNPTPLNINLFASNPSNQNAMEVRVLWGWTQNFRSTVGFTYTSVSGQLFIDGSPISDFVNETTGLETGGGPVELDISTAGAAHSFTLNSGQTSILTLTLTPQPGSSLPDVRWLLKNMYLSVYGVAP